MFERVLTLLEFLCVIVFRHIIEFTFPPSTPFLLIVYILSPKYETRYINVCPRHFVGIILMSEMKRILINLYTLSSSTTLWLGTMIFFTIKLRSKGVYNFNIIIVYGLYKTIFTNNNYWPCGGKFEINLKTICIYL